MRPIVHCSASAFDAQFKGYRHKRRIASRSLHQRPLCNSGVKWSSLVGVYRSEQSCLLIGLPTARSHQLANTGCYCERNEATQRTPPGVGQRLLCGVYLLTNCSTEFCSDGLYAISRNSPVREFFSREREIFSGPGKSSPVNIPSCNVTDFTGHCHLSSQFMLKCQSQTHDGTLCYTELCTSCNWCFCCYQMTNTSKWLDISISQPTLLTTSQMDLQSVRRTPPVGPLALSPWLQYFCTRFRMKWVTLQSSCSPAAPGERSVSDGYIYWTWNIYVRSSYWRSWFLCNIEMLQKQ